MRKELKAQLDYKFALTHAFKNAEINCQIDLKKQQKEQKKKNKAARYSYFPADLKKSTKIQDLKQESAQEKEELQRIPKKR